MTTAPRILVVDDEPLAIEVLCATLEGLGDARANNPEDRAQADHLIPVSTPALKFCPPARGNGAGNHLGKQHGHPVDQFTLFALAHVFDLLGQMFDVQGGKLAGT